MKISTQILCSIVGITLLTQLIFGSIAYWIISSDNSETHASHLQQIVKIIQNNVSLSELGINPQLHLDRLFESFTTDETILLLNKNNTLVIAGIAPAFSSKIYQDIIFANSANSLSPHSATVLIDNKEFHWYSSQINDETELIILESCDQYKSGSTLGARLLTTSIIITWIGIWIGLVLSHIISRSLKAKNKELEHQAFHDQLTGLPNRLLFLDRLEQALLNSDREGKSFALLLMDLDNFKDLNDTLGHHYGDELLQQVGEKIKESLRKRDTFARLGGDEFAAILYDVEIDKVLICIDKLRDNMKTPYSINETLVESKASIGVALYPFHGNDSQTLLQHADVAMYQAKKTRSGYAIYDSRFNVYSLRRLQLMNELRGAIENNHISVFYQPMISQSENRVVAVEALARWNHPDMGFIPSDEFIPVAEQTGIIRQLTLFVLKTALGDCKSWRDQGYDIRISINLSPHCLQDVSFPDNLQSILDDSGMASTNVDFEITETALMQDLNSAKNVLQHFNDAGYKISIDDFGTGFSSLEHLKELPIDTLKIDKTFVMDMNENERDAAIVRSVIELGHNLNCKVVAEGVENEKTLKKLIEFDVDVLQGYFFAKPMPSEQLESWLVKESLIKSIRI